MREGEYGTLLGNQIEGVGLAYRACCPLTLDESSARMRNEELGIKAAASPPF